MKRPEEEKKLIRLLEEAGPGSAPTLEPDPHLPTRIRALARARTEVHTAKKHRWIPVSLATAALAGAIMIGSYLGYSAGMSLATAGQRTDEATQSVDALWSAWSQSGFAEDLVQVEVNGR